MVVKCTFAGQLTGQRTIGEPLLLKKLGHKQTNSLRVNSDTPKIK